MNSSQVLDFIILKNKDIATSPMIWVSREEPRSYYN